MKANAGSFSKGRDNGRKVDIGTVTIRRDKSGRSRAWVKIADNGNSYDWKLRAVVVWESKHGPLKPGKLVHHKDRDTLNDSIRNLQEMTRSEHLAEHKKDYESKRKRAASKAAKARHKRNRAAKSSAAST